MYTIIINNNEIKIWPILIILFSAGFDRLALGWKVKSKEDAAVSTGKFV